MSVILSLRTERFKQGKALRGKTPRETHADLKGSLSRNAVAILAESDRDRVPVGSIDLRGIWDSEHSRRRCRFAQRIAHRNLRECFLAK